MSDSAARLAAALADRYRIERELGAGGMATVYLAHDLRTIATSRSRSCTRSSAPCSAPSGSSPRSGPPPTCSIRTSCRCSTPGEADGLAFYVMPYVEGESLRERLDRERQLPIDDALRIAREVASALDYAHRHGVIHRDIKPENILLQEGTAARRRFRHRARGERRRAAPASRETGLSLGTPQYMSPEQATGERALDGRSDIYSLGAVLYEMLTGEPPTPGRRRRRSWRESSPSGPPPCARFGRPCPPASRPR